MTVENPPPPQVEAKPFEQALLQTAANIVGAATQTSAARISVLEKALDEAKAAALAATSRQKESEITAKYKQLQIDAYHRTARFGLLVVVITFVVWYRFDSLSALLSPPKGMLSQAEALLKETDPAKKKENEAWVRNMGKALLALVPEAGEAGRQAKPGTPVEKSGRTSPP